MATESASPRPRRRAKSGPRLVGFDEFIASQFAKTRNALRSVEILSALARWLTGALVFLLVIVLLDHWLIPGGLAIWARWTALVVLVLASAGYLGYAVGIPLVRRISLPYAARTIERSEPSLKNNLINFLDLRSRPEQFSPAVIELVEQQAATDLSRVEVENAVSRERLVKSSYALLAMVVLGCAYVLLSPKSPFTTFGRVLLPSASISPPTKVRIVEVLPGDAKVFAGDEVDIMAATGISDGVTPDRVALYYTTESRKYVDEAVDMVPVPDKPRHWQARMRGDSARSAGLQESFTYRIHAGDFTTRDYRIKVIQAPSARVEKVVYDYPEYTGFEQRTLNAGDVDALEGTTVTVTAKTNMPAEQGVLHFGGNVNDLVLERIESPGEQGDLLKGSFVLGFQRDGTPRYEKYEVRFKTVDGELNPNPILYRIQTRRDYPPTVSIPKPGRDLSWPANAPLPLKIEAEDKDFALRSVKLYVTQGRRNLLERDLGPQGDLGSSLRTVHNLDLAQLDLAAGDVIQYWAEALDNKEPQANRTESTHYEVRILSPVSPEERQQQIADASKQIEEQQQQLQDSPPDEQPAADQGDERAREPSDSGAKEDESSQLQRDAETIEKILKKLQQEQAADDQPKASEQPGADAPQDSEASSPNDKKGEQQPPSASDALQKPDAGKEKGSKDSESGAQRDQSPGAESGAGKSAEPPKPDGEPGSRKSGAGQAGKNSDDKQPTDAARGGRESPKKTSDSEAASKPGTDGTEPSKDPASAAPKPGSSDQPGTETRDDAGEAKTSKKEPGEDGRGTEQQEPSASDDAGKGRGTTESGSPKPGQAGDDSSRQGTQKPDNATPQASDQPGQPGEPTTPQSAPQSEPQNPTQDTRSSDKQGQDSGNAPGAGKPSPGQQAPQPGSGQDGSQAVGQQGGKPSDQPGASDATRPGGQQPSERPTGQGGAAGQQSPGDDAGSQKSGGSKPGAPPDSPSNTENNGSGQADGKAETSDSAQPGSGGKSASDDPSAGQGQGRQQGEQNQPGGGSGTSNQPADGQAPPGQGERGTGNANSGKGDHGGDSKSVSSQSGGGPGDASPAKPSGDGAESPATPDEANEAYARKATNLVLDYLREQSQQGELDPKLLEDLGRTPEEMKKLMSRLEELRDSSNKSPEALSPEEAERLRAFEESVRRQRIDQATFKRGSTGTRTDPRAVFQRDRAPVPPEYEELYKAFVESVQGQRPRSDR